ncbi:MAG: SsrA-binding protein SmpB [Elusimicrobiota bacterium]
MNIAQNRKAYHEYEIIEEFEAGMELAGYEVKSLRQHKADINHSYVIIESGEAFIVNAHINPYEHTHYVECDPLRKRRLLLKKRELAHLKKKTEEKGLTIIPLKMYFKKGWAKLLIGLARGKNKRDKRDTLKRKAVEREIEREHKLERKKYI